MSIKPRPSILLPPTLASRILDLQLLYQSKTISRQSLSQLLTLYTQAVQFYQQHNDQKFVVFQSRLTNVLKNPYVISILQGESAIKIKQKQIQEITKKAESSAVFDANSLMKTAKDQKERLENKVVKQVSSQKSKILERVMNRSFNKSFMGSQKSIRGEVKDGEKKRYDSYIVEKKGEKGKPKKDEKKGGNILDVFNKIEVFELPQRRKNIRAPMF